MKLKEGCGVIGRLKGILAEKSAGRLILDVSGVGYEVLIPFSTYYELGEVGDTISLQIYTHVREGTSNLYGFLTNREKKLFTQLIQVSGIGPKLGVTILSGLPVDEFIDSITRCDVVKLNSIPGVGKKTAERLVMEMKDKLLDLTPSSSRFTPTGISRKVQDDVISALVNLGYSRNIAEKKVSESLERAPTERFEVLLRNSLKKISS